MSQSGCCGKNIEISLNQFKQISVQYKSQIHPHSSTFTSNTTINKNGFLKFNRGKL